MLPLFETLKTIKKWSNLIRDHNNTWISYISETCATCNKGTRVGISSLKSQKGWNQWNIKPCGNTKKSASWMRLEVLSYKSDPMLWSFYSNSAFPLETCLLPVTSKCDEPTLIPGRHQTSRSWKNLCWPVHSKDKRAFVRPLLHCEKSMKKTLGWPLFVLYILTGSRVHKWRLLL